MFSSLTLKLSVFITLSMGLTHMAAHRLNDTAFMLSIGTLVALLVSASFIHHYVSIPLATLTKSMRLLEQGDSNAKLQINGSRQMTALSESFNLMVDRVMLLVDNTAQKVFDLAQVQERAQHELKLLEINKELEKSLAEVNLLGSRQEAMYLGIINAMVSTIEANDPYTHGHSARVTNYSLALARKIGFSAERLKKLEQAGILHDIGKIGIDKAILHKPEKLTVEEYAIMQQHPAIGVQILRNIETLSSVQEIVAKHHERYDGKGYPNRIKGRDLPTEALILAIADTFDAMTSHRPYRTGLPVEVAIKELSDHAGSQFDPELVEHFIALLREGELTAFLDKDPLLPRDSFLEIDALQKSRGAVYGTVNILVVEDDPYCASLVRDYLRHMGHTVDEAATGSDGIRMFTEKQYELVLLDIGLPDYDGYTVAKGLRQIERELDRSADSEAIICALTSCSQEEGGPLALASGMNLFITKPIDTVVIMDIIEMASQVARRNSSQAA